MPREHFAALVAQADAFFARVAARLGEHMACAAGCSSCCIDGLGVTAIEAEAIRELIAARGQPIIVNERGGCAALDAEGLCQIYEARPLRCRTHGVPIVSSGDEPDPRRRLPVVSSCELNFIAEGALEESPPDCRLDPETLSTKLFAIDAAWSDSRGEPRGRRVGIRELLEKT